VIRAIVTFLFPSTEIYFDRDIVQAHIDRQAEENSKLRRDMKIRQVVISNLKQQAADAQRKYGEQLAEIQRLRDWQRIEIAGADNNANAWIAYGNAAAIEAMRLKSVLEWYANEDHYDVRFETTDSMVTQHPPEVIADGGEKARAALDDFLAAKPPARD
jgi:hypothetical protein